MLEPIQGENGVVLPPEGYLKKVRTLCTKNKALLILDEVQVGMGRTGMLFAYEHYGIKPDIMTLSKALGGGIPCGAFLTTDKIAKHLGPGMHGTTLGGNPLAMSTAIAVLNTIQDEGLLDGASTLGGYFLEKLKALAAKYKKEIKEVRGKGLILGIEFKKADIAKSVVNKSIDMGLLTILTKKKVMRILPPLNVKKKEIDAALKIIDKALGEVSDA